MPQIEQFTKEFNLPGPIASYLRAVNTGAKEEFPASFADDAVVVDVNRELRGLDAITAWAGPSTWLVGGSTKLWSFPYSPGSLLATMNAARSSGVLREHPTVTQTQCDVTL